MAEASAIGIQPHTFWRYTPRDLYAAFAGEKMAGVRRRKAELTMSWQTANFTRAKKLPELTPMLRRLDGPRVMTKQAIRATIIGMAHAMGAKVVYKKRGDP